MHVKERKEGKEGKLTSEISQSEASMKNARAILK